METNDFFKQVGQQIQQLREKAGLSQTELARIIDIDPSVLSKFEKKGQKLPADRINQIANVLGYELAFQEKKTA